MAEARYWRVSRIEPYLYEGGLVLSELALYNDATRVDGSAMLTATVSPTSGSLTDLGDASFAANVTWNTEAVLLPGFALVFDFGTAQRVNKIGVAGPSRNTFAHKFSLEYSSDGIVWVELVRTDPASKWVAANALFEVAESASGDLSYANVLALLNFNGVNGSTAITDISPSPKTYTANNGAAISTAQSKFGGASAAFDGVNDSISCPGSADFNFDSGDFTIEAWVYATTTSGLGAIVAYANGSAQNSNYQFQLLRNGSVWQFDVFSGNTAYGGQIGSVDTNTWVHVAFVRASGNLFSFVNGALLKTTTVSTVSLNSLSSATLGIGRSLGFYPWSGYIDDLRITKGVARYTANFTPPTAEFTSGQLGDAFLSSVGLLLHADGVDASTAVIDSSNSAKAVAVVGTAQIDTAQSKFGGASLLLPSGGGYVTIAQSTDWEFGTGDFTIEAWIRVDNLAASRGIFGRGDSGVSGYLDLYVFTNGALYTNLYLNGGGVVVVNSAASAIALNTWYHVAFVRQGSTFRQYINGVSQGTPGSSALAARSITGPLSVGSLGGGTFPFSGHIDEARVTKGVARYTADFTPPTAAFPDSTSSSDATPLRGNRAPVLGIVSEYTPPAVGVSQFPPTLGVFDIEDGGRFQIVGTVKEVALPVNTPLARRVALYEERSGRLIKRGFSDNAGNYSFTEIRGDRPYTVIAFDHTDTYRAVVADKLNAEPMP